MMTLKQARELAGLSQAELGAAVGASRFLISKLETGRVAPAVVAHGTIVNIVRTLHRRGLVGLKADELFPVLERVA